MKHLLLTTIAAVVLVGCGNPTVLLPGGAGSLFTELHRRRRRA